jgi:hypothetical protein
MEENTFIKFVYTFFLGILIALFVGLGISTFYPAPEMPEYPNTTWNYDREPTEEERNQQEQYDKAIQRYDEDQRPYSRNVSIISLSIGVVLLAVSLGLERRKIRAISDGIMLGGLFTLLYSLGRGFASQDSQYVFIAVSIALVIVLYLGYRRFVYRPEVAAKSNKSARKK